MYVLYLRTVMETLYRTAVTAFLLSMRGLHEVIVIVIVKSRFLERPQKRSRRNQLIHRRLTKTKSIGSDQDPDSQAGRQSDGYGGWCLELRRGGRYKEDDKAVGL